MPQCQVGLCKTSTKDLHGLHYHRFPHDEPRRSIWIRSCGRKDFSSPTSASMGICSLHFTDSSYKRDLQAELLGTVPKYELKENAVPTCNLPEKRENVQVMYPPTEERSAAKKLAHARFLEEMKQGT